MLKDKKSKNMNKYVIEDKKKYRKEEMSSNFNRKREEKYLEKFQVQEAFSQSKKL